MMKDCKNCNHATGTVDELMRLYDSDDSGRLIKILTDTIVTDKNLHQDDKVVLSKMMHLVTTLMEEKLQEQKAELQQLKKTA
jgi:hypothetical protein